MTCLLWSNQLMTHGSLFPLKMWFCSGKQISYWILHHVTFDGLHNKVAHHSQELNMPFSRTLSWHKIVAMVYSFISFSPLCLCTLFNLHNLVCIKIKIEKKSSWKDKHQWPSCLWFLWGAFSKNKIVVVPCEQQQPAVSNVHRKRDWSSP